MRIISKKKTYYTYIIKNIKFLYKKYTISKYILFLFIMFWEALVILINYKMKKKTHKRM